MCNRRLNEMNGLITKSIFLCLICLEAIQLSTSKSIVAPNQSVGVQSEGVSTTKRSYTCKCEDTSEPLCANNGVTYKNACRFECAKHREERLRVVKEGNCGKYISKLQFWSFG